MHPWPVDAYRILREAGFVNINLDLMYAFPGQTKEELEEDVRAIALLGSEHLSLYTLTIEPNSRFYAAQMKLDDDEKLAEHYLLIARILNEYGFKQYEVSNFSRTPDLSRRITGITGWGGLILVWGWAPMGLPAGGVTGTRHVCRIILSSAAGTKDVDRRV